MNWENSECGSLDVTEITAPPEAPRSSSGLAPQSKLLHFLDYASNLHVVTVLPPDLTSQMLADFFQECWVKHYGKPAVLTVDAAKVNVGGVFMRYCDQNSVEIRQAAGEAHWQVGRIEANGRWWKHMFERVLKTV